MSCVRGTWFARESQIDSNLGRSGREGKGAVIRIVKQRPPGCPKSIWCPVTGAGTPCLASAWKCLLQFLAWLGIVMLCSFGACMHAM